MQRPQTKFYADTMNHPKVIRSKKSTFFIKKSQNFKMFH